jgi:peptide/nickel transport system ATP-binding protein
MTEPLISVDGLVKHFVVRRSLLGKPQSVVQAVDGVSFEVAAGETLALVG